MALEVAKLRDEREVGATVPHNKRPRHLAARVMSTLRDEIMTGQVAVGDKLPSEARLCERFEVSRTVVREAIAGLRADGLVMPRQGAGVFVLAPPEAPFKPFQIVDSARISEVVEVLELRVAIEVEAAALAARRRTPAQEEIILGAANEIRHCNAEGRPSEDADLAFHVAIADATNNPRFRELLDLLGAAMIPRAALRLDDDESCAGYLNLIALEHDRIADAILAGDADAAREAMYAHLHESITRYRNIQRAQRDL